ncbi:MAG TPA: CPBP family glutamic-type intramembrane protease [Rudaea sp.]|nr:CPBP family glutamic-type intramembrane protease [Rudaea sp.]
MQTSGGTLLKAAGFAVLVIATAWLLDRFAQARFTAHLRDNAARALAFEASGRSPYRWRFRDAEDVVAGRVFGAAESEFRDGELVVRSSGATFEVGLPLPRPLDVRRYTRLDLAYSSSHDAELGIVVRQRLYAHQIVGTAGTLAHAANTASVALSEISWKDGEQPIAAPLGAAMLRLRVALPAGAELHLREVRLERAADASGLDLSLPPRLVDAGDDSAGFTHVYRMPLNPEARIAAIATLAEHRSGAAPVLVSLPLRGRVEQQIALRNAVFDSLPGAILIPEGAVEASFEDAREFVAAPPQKHPRYLLGLIGLYACALIWTRLRPPERPRLRALVEILLTLAGPLWLIVGDGFAGNMNAAQVGLIVLSLAYAISLSEPRQWHWNGSARAWLLALGVVALAGALAAIAYRPGAQTHAISPGHLARYVVWALLQQYLICVVCTERWRIATGSAAAAAYLGALGFAILHTPNAALMIATFVGGLCWCALYLRERALLPIACSHAASALLLLALLPRDILLSAEVSARFFL